MLKRTLAAGFMVLSTLAAADEAVVIVMDGSGSMWGQIDGVNKITIAREVVSATLGDQPGSKAVGLLAYGHNRKGDCKDIEVLVHPAPASGGAIAAAVAGINPKGKTPLTAAVREAAQLLNHTEQAATVVLVTDGQETCEADPCALARELEQTGVNFTAHVVGFGLNREQGAQVACLADETGGQFFSADSAAELSTALSSTIIKTAAPAPQPTVPVQERPRNNLQINVQITEDSPPLEEGQIQRLDLRLVLQADQSEKRLGGIPSQAHSVDAGDYLLRALFEGGTAEMPVKVEEFDVTHATLVLNAGEVDFRALPVGDAFEINANAISWQVTRLSDNKRFDLFVPHYKAVLGVGRYRIQAVIDRNPKMSPPPVNVVVTKGGLIEGEVFLPNGRFSVKPVSETGQTLPDSHIRFRLQTLKSDGSPGEIAGSKAGARDPILALPGDYLLTVEDWGIGKQRRVSQPVTVAPGGVLKMMVVLPTDPAAPLPQATR